MLLVLIVLVLINTVGDNISVSALDHRREYSLAGVCLLNIPKVLDSGPRTA